MLQVKRANVCLVGSVNRFTIPAHVMSSSVIYVTSPARPDCVITFTIGQFSGHNYLLSNYPLSHSYYAYYAC